METYVTLKEIQSQPRLWKETIDLVRSKKQQIEIFLKPLKEKGTIKIVFIGAGSSEYVGNALVPILNPYYDYTIRSIASTELVDDPYEIINPSETYLAISFGRSGNSPESMQAITALNHVCSNVYHLVITCNAEGQLAKISNHIANSFVLVLPEETHDQGFAMTSSFSSMSLAAYIVLHPNKLEDKLNHWLKDINSKYHDWINQADKLVKEFEFNRYVVLGGHESKGFAQESALKMLELSSGRVSTQYDSPMGFRHGPKSFLNENTLVVIFKRNSIYSSVYEDDIINEIEKSSRKSKVHILNFNIEENYLSSLSQMIFTQSLAYFKSVSLNINPDSPSSDNEVNRVVTGVKLYPYK
jgi:tagatose-6-phosphate ketose/aldose isomerase